MCWNWTHLKTTGSLETNVWGLQEFNLEPLGCKATLLTTRPPGPKSGSQESEQSIEAFSSFFAPQRNESWWIWCCRHFLPSWILLYFFLSRSLCLPLSVSPSLSLKVLTPLSFPPYFLFSSFSQSLPSLLVKFLYDHCFVIFHHSKTMPRTIDNLINIDCSSVC